MRRAILLIALTIFSAAPALADRVKLDAPKPVTVSGRVTAPGGKPVDGAQVYLIDHENRLKLSGRTNAEGHFAIKHERVGFDSLQIVPPVDSNLAQAILKDMPASEGRHMLISLKPGMLVTGKVLAAGHPLKGVTVRAFAKNSAGRDGAEAVTNRKGQYELHLTAGEKVFEISDVHEAGAVGLHRERFMVRSAGVLPDIEVPSNHATEQ